MQMFDETAGQRVLILLIVGLSCLTLAMGLSTFLSGQDEPESKAAAADQALLEGADRAQPLKSRVSKSWWELTVERVLTETELE